MELNTYGERESFWMNGIPYVEWFGGALLAWHAADKILERAQFHTYDGRPFENSTFDVLASARHRVERWAERECRRA